jgi:fatty acid-binding protein DegV
MERIRTKGKAMDRLVEIIAEKCSGKKDIRLATLHANAPEDAKKILESASSLLKPTETLFTEVSPVVGAHTGPGTVGLAYMVDA